MLAQFIVECESAAPGSELVVPDLIESVYDFGNGNTSMSGGGANGPMVLMAAHRAKGMEFDHVLLLDGSAWSQQFGLT